MQPIFLFDENPSITTGEGGFCWTVVVTPATAKVAACRQGTLQDALPMPHVETSIPGGKEEQEQALLHLQRCQLPGSGRRKKRQRVDDLVTVCSLFCLWLKLSLLLLGAAI